MQIERLEVATLIGDPANARKHNERNIDAIVASLARFGQQKPIVIDKANVVRAGNGTLQAARSLGWTHVDCVRSKLDGADASAYAIADNRTAELAEWDDDVLAATLEGLQLEGMLDVTGFDDDELAELLKQVGAEVGDVVEDDVPEPPAEPITKPGDLWLLGDHRLLCGDSTKAEDVERLMGGVKAEMLFTSPPYSDMREYNGESELSPNHLAKFLDAFAPHIAYAAVNLGLKRDGGELDEYWQFYIAAARRVGMKMLSWNVWNRENCGFSVGAITAMFAIQHEFIFVFGEKPKKLNLTVPNKEAGILNTHIGQRQADGSTSKQDDRIIRQFRQLGTVQTVNTQLARDGIEHSARMPAELPAAYIDAMSNLGDAVAEPFCGSGTTLIAAEQLGRKCYGMEISAAYCDVIVKRWETLTGKKAVLDGHS